MKSVQLDLFERSPNERKRDRRFAALYAAADTAKREDTPPKAHKIRSSPMTIIAKAMAQSR